MTSGTNSNSGIHSLYNFDFFCKQNIAKRMLYIGLKKKKKVKGMFIVEDALS